MPLKNSEHLSGTSQPIYLRMTGRVWLGLAILVSAGIPNPSLASNGDKVIVPLSRAPASAYSTQSGLQLEIDTTWAGNRGYRPVRVTARKLKPATAETLITIQFSAGNWRNARQAIAVETDFELPQGAASSATTFSVPQYLDWNHFSWEVWVDGVKDEELSIEAMGYNSGSPGAAAVGVLGPSLWNSSNVQLLQMASSSTLETFDFDIAKLPEQWIDLSSFDAFTMKLGQLELLYVSDPEKYSQLLRWLRAGGNLWVTELGDEFAELAKLERMLSSANEVSSPEEIPLDAWHFLELDGEGQVRLKDLVRLSMQEKAETDRLSPSQMILRDDPRQAVDSREWFQARAFGMGTVVAFADLRERQQDKLGYGGWAGQRSAVAQNLNWSTRHGNDPAKGNPNFNHLLIPDVGAAPVFAFQMLITLFAIAIGPVNYWLLKRKNQLPLLLLTVPMAALVTTLMLFAYGFFADGIGVRVRARSLTVLDQRAGEAASWARLSYYAGIAPSDGVSMPDDTAVYPILPSRSEYNNFGSRHIDQERELEWSPRQELVRGWMGSRTPTQYLAVTSRPTQKRLTFSTQTDQCRATNHLETKVLALCVQDKQGNIFLGEELEPEETLTLQRSNYLKATSKLRLWLTENLPQLPAGYVESKRMRDRDYSAGMTESLMELHMEAIISPLATGWGDGTYVAITAAGIEVPLGVEGITETSSFHVVRGTW